ncbi:MAG TPA: hypothetical protein VGZ73_14675 [Bryobacteraceae bacterium]|jgi:hypothetical protein|nr:hypothetical protein [Bryobacteraceae bacterium]
MSNFLVNIASRGAGLPVSPIRVPAPLLAKEAGSGGLTGMEPATDSATGETTVPEKVQAGFEPNVQQSAAKRQLVRPVASGVEPLGPIEAASTNEEAPTLIADAPARKVEKRAAQAVLTFGATLRPSESSDARALIDRQAQAVPRAVAISEAGEPSPTGRSAVTIPLRTKSGESPLSAGAVILSAPTPTIRPSPSVSPLPDGLIGAAILSGPTAAIRPAEAAPPTAHFRSPARTASPPEPAQAAIHVRIGRVEVRAKAEPPAQHAAKPAPPAPLGFAQYARQRTYRNWPL